MTAAWSELAGALAGAPSLPGAKCRGRAHLFDPAATSEPTEVVAQRHAQALGLCQRCPALDACTEWVSSLRPSRRPPGVVAGKVITPMKSRKKGTPTP